ncbi:MAG: peptide chain release factor N(5)-glutamine methyltransferase [Candidatus Omnitrophica bacterium]|nr:peptide chain release factor N(5)-glutamine methyltransferase [Candidatus Omnitrophota bacterium]
MNEAELLFSRMLKCDKLSLYLNRKTKLGRKNGEFASLVLRKRVSGYPLQYILGKADFFGEEFLVTEAVFIPRPETEILVETALKLGLRVKGKGLKLNILDLGTGSGCIAIFLAKLLHGADITATDISVKALEVAKENARLHHVNINFIQGDLFDTYPLPLTTYHLIVNNPPYIASQEINKLQPEISFEPRMSLDGGKDGLDFYRKIIKQAPLYLKDDGILAFEIGFDQLARIEKILQKQPNMRIIDIIRDYAGIERVVIAQKGK